jgi:hypothetical protein
MPGGYVAEASEETLVVGVEPLIKIGGDQRREICYEPQKQSFHATMMRCNSMLAASSE